MKNFLKKCKESFTRLLIKCNVLNLDVCVAHKVKDSELFFICYQDGDKLIDLWSFSKGQEEEFAAMLTVYFSKLKGYQIIEDSISAKDDLDGNVEVMMNAYLDFEKRLNQPEEDSDYSLVEIGKEPPVVSPVNMYRVQAVPAKREL